MFPNRHRHWLAGLVLAALTAPVAHADIELAPFAGFRMGGEFDIRDSTDDSTSRLDFDDTASLGLVVNVDLAEPGKQLEFYYSRQDTTATTTTTLLAPETSSVDLVIHQLQFGGLYFPGGQTTGGFASGVIGVTRLDPKDSGLDSHHRASLTLGGGYKLPLSRNILLRLDLRGIYTVLDSGGAVFCSGGCTARFESSGYLQVEAGAGLVLRF